MKGFLFFLFGVLVQSRYLNELPTELLDATSIEQQQPEPTTYLAQNSTEEEAASIEEEP